MTNYQTLGSPSVKGVLLPVFYSKPACDVLPVTVLFGTPSRQCRGQGICMVAERRDEVAAPPFSCPLTPALLVQVSPARLQLIVPVSGLSEAVASRQFSGAFFEVKEAFLLPEFIRKYFKSPDNACIPVGHYPVKQDEQYFTIYLDTSD